MNKRTKENIVGATVFLMFTSFTLLMAILAPVLRGEV
jgi:hypothetical protein